MAGYRQKTGRYNLRVVVQRRALGSKGSNGEDAATWPDPDAGTHEYSAARESLTAGETIVQGLANSTGGMRLRIKGRSIPVAAYDRVKVKATGEVFEVTGVSRDEAETVLSLDRVRSQSTGQ